VRLRTTERRWVIFECINTVCGNERWPVGDHERQKNPEVMRCPRCNYRGVPVLSSTAKRTAA